MRFNPPPNWPLPPKEWEPDPYWKPDPWWPPPPPGWPLWVNAPDARRVAPAFNLDAVARWFSTSRNRAIGIGGSAAVLLFIIVLAVAISSSGETSRGTESANPSHSNSSNKSRASLAEAKGIIVLNESASECDVYSLDPDSGALQLVASFRTVFCDANKSYGEAAWKHIFSSKFDRAATQSGGDYSGQAGWVDRNGVITAFTPTASHPDFGSTSSLDVLGFDKHDNYYFGLQGDQTVDYYRVPAGSTTAEKVTSQPRDVKFGPLAGGTLGPGGDDPEATSADCTGWGLIHYDPDQKLFAYSFSDRVFVTAHYCFYDGVPITPKINGGGVDNDVVISPDGNTVVFANRSGNKLYRVASDGKNAPVEINAPNLFRLSNSWLFEWI